MNKHIVVIEDDADIQRLLRLNLEADNYRVSSFETLEAAEAFFQQGAADLIILDLMLPDGNGLDLCQNLRRQACFTPIIILSAKGDEVERILGLEFGADDYMAKPFSVRELLARIKAMLRRNSFQQQQSEQEEVIQCGDLFIKISAREAFINESPLTLTNTEFDLLLHMAKKPGHVFSREKLLADVWGYQHRGYEHTVNSHINRLRSKLQQHAAAKTIKTVWGVGYKFSV